MHRPGARTGHLCLLSVARHLPKGVRGHLSASDPGVRSLSLLKPAGSASELSCCAHFSCSCRGPLQAMLVSPLRARVDLSVRAMPHAFPKWFKSIVLLRVIFLAENLVLFR